MKNIAKLLSSWSATKRNSLASMLSKAVLIAIGLWCLCSLPAFAADVPVVGAPFDPEAQLTPEQGRQYYDRNVTGDWWGLRTRLHNRGIDFNLDYFSEMATNFSGGKDNFNGYAKNFGQSWAYTDQALFGLDLDFNKMFGWDGASFQFYVTKRTGDNLSSQVNPNT